MDEAEDAEEEEEEEEEEYEDTDEELNKAQAYSKQGVVDIIDNFMNGTDAFNRLAPDFPDVEKQKPDLPSKKPVKRAPTPNPVKDAQQKRLRKDHQAFVKAAEAAP